MDQQLQITGTVKDINGQPIPGVNVLEKGTSKGVQTDFDGNFTLNVSNPKATLVLSFLGFVTKEVPLNNQTNFKITLLEDVSKLEEVVVVGYGTQKKVNLTASVTQIGSEVFENRPVSNAAQALQGAVGNLQITNSSFGGEPGASSNINIRGFVTSSGIGVIGESGPLVLIDGIEMEINNIDPEDIATVSVLKDAAAASIYGARAAGGAILITTKSGKNMKGGMKISYSSNYSISQPTLWPDQVDAYTFALVMNDAAKNIGSTPYYDAQQLGWIQQNMAIPGSAPTLVPTATNDNWDQSSFGIDATGATNWKDFLFKDWAERKKHNLNITGGDEKLNYYVSAGIYDEGGLLRVGGESFQRYNLDAKIAAKPNKWLSFELLTKMLKSKDEFPWDYSQGTVNGRGRVFDLLSKLKPTLPTVDPLYGEPLVQAVYPLWSTQREKNEDNQVILLPRITIEPIQDWLINLQYNYKRNNNRQIFTALQYQYKQPNGTVVSVPEKESTQVRPTLFTNEYFSPNLFTSYTKSLGNHNFKILAGYQSEKYEVYNLSGSALYLLSDNVPSISTAVGQKLITDAISHWSTESVFSRLNYNYNEKYFFGFTYREDGSSRFEEGQKRSGYPSFEAGYNVAKENFWPLKDYVNMFKLRATYGTLGNQNVDNYLSILRIPISNGTYLFNGQWDFFANTPDFTSNNLTWETVKTTDVGIDVGAFKNKLNMSFDWYRTDIEGMAARGASLPGVLGTEAPLTNIGVSRVQGWEAEVSWRQNLGNFGYHVKAVLSDYKRSIVEYPNPTNLLSNYFAGQDLGDIWGLKWEGWFQSAEEVTQRNQVVNQSFVNATWTPGDTKYVDLNGDGFINNGTNTLGNSGDFSVIGNTTPRYQYSLTLGCNWKGFDLNMFFQGVGKRDVLVSNHQRFRGPAQGPLHANVLTGHLDYWRDDSSPLGANPDAYFPKPYAANPGDNNRNYRFNVDRYIQNGAYTRLKSVQIGYTLPKEVTSKCKIDKIRFFMTGENLFTVSKLMFYDPETTPGNFGSAYSYPLAKIISTGINISF
ncbi:TonB-dependent receptor [Flavobacterium sp. UMI-01]|uniref:SusC/RagA family TonB-linked outer membrane protein n=1 Tax=Flavobacterium sp. UMI-01 TaxID=1441053 RepID=UPI001C7E0626|nr:TonB-dependent receptor [Flavobacterium sp. UMI-01]GIZ10229.1 SusC/RagA family TonB-linked outer membrane protein [Flavobacterium sp. UMI-01]